MCHDSVNGFYMSYLRNGSWFGLLHQVMDARGMLGEHEKSVRVGRGHSRESATLDF